MNGWKKALIGLFVVAAILFAFIRLKTLIYSILVGLAIAYIADEPVKWLEKKIGRTSSVVLVLLLSLCLLGAVILLFVPLVGREFLEFSRQIPAMIANINEIIDGWHSDVTNQIIAYLQAKSGEVVANFAMKVAQRSWSSIAWLIVSPFIAFYVLKDKKYFSKQLEYLIPVQFRIEILELWKRIDYSLRQFIKGQLMVSVTVGALTALGLALLGVPYAALLGTLMGICNIVPFAGPFIGAVPIAVVSAFEGFRTLIGSILVVLAVQQLENMVISPQIIGGSLKIHPLYVVLAILIGGTAFGFCGVILAIPVLIVLREAASYVLNTRLYGREGEAEK